MALLALVTGYLLLAQTKALAPANPALIERFSDADEGYRLRRVSEPLKYDLFLDISDSQFYGYKGHVDIEMRYLDTSNHFYLSSAGLVIDESSIVVTKANGEILPVADFIPMEKYEQIYFGFRERLEQNAIYTVHVEFANNIGVELKGLYRSSYRIGNSTRYIATTHFESTYARTVFPCYDEPSYKAVFNIDIRHRAQYHALSNTRIKESTPDGNDFVITRFETTPLMSTYLVAFIVSDFQTLATDQDRIRVYAPENRVQHTTYAQEFAEQSLAYLEDLFGHDFQLPKVDLVAIPDFNMGAMENWGLITFRAIYLIYDEQTTAARTKQSIADLITHEFVHSWFGNEVTPEWWTYLWLSEGFARYFEYYVTAKIETSWQLWDQFVVTNVHAALSQDDKATNRAMSHYATEPDVLNGLFDYIVYAKSASVIRMIENVIGFSAFLEALSDYIGSRSFQTTKPDYLYASLEKFSTVALPATIAEIFNSWADNVGYPVVTAIRNGNTITYSQKRFWTPVEGVEAPPENRFYIPLNYITNEDPVTEYAKTSPSHWLIPSIPQITLELPSSVDWILVNKLQTGYYRVNYDVDNWAALTATLKTPGTTIPDVNRAQLIDDVCNLAKAGHVSYDVALTLLQYLEAETGYIPWSTAYNAIIFLNRMLSATDANYSGFERFIQSLTEKVYASVRLTGSDTHIARLHRGNSVYLACYFGVKSCIADAVAMVKRLSEDETYVIPDEIQNTVFCANSKYGTEAEQNSMTSLLVRYFSAKDKDTDMFGRLLTGIGCTRSVEKIKTYLKLTITGDDGITMTGVDRTQLLTAVIAGSSEGLAESLQFIVDSYLDIYYLYSSLAGVFTELGNRINNQAAYDLLKAISDKYEKDFPESVKPAVERALIQAHQNLAWTREHSAVINVWLNTNEYVPATPPPDDDGSASSVKVGTLLTIALLFINVLLF